MFLKKSDRLALIDFNGDKINYNTLVAKVKYFSNHFMPKGNKETFGIIFMENRLEYIYSFYALWDSFNVPITIDAMSSINELTYFLKDSNSKLIMVSNYTVNIVKEAKEKLNLEDLVIINVDEIEIKEEDDDRILNHPNDENLAVMLYTSGTTGDPKGVMLTYSNIYNQIKSIKSLKATKENEQVLAVLPYHHILPLMSTNLFFLHHEQQFSIVFVEKLSSQAILKALDENDVTILSMVPRVYKMFYKSIKDTIDSKWITRMIYKLAKFVNNKKFSRIVFKKVHEKFGGKLDYLISGGAKSDIEMIEFFNVLGFTYCEGYGLTETSPVIAGSTPSNGGVPGTVGKPVYNIEIKIVNEELWVKGPIVMKGYYNKPEKTAEVITEDGWFKTGDLVSLDENGNITILGRKNSMIVLSNGKNIDPENLENKLLNHSSDLIKEVGIFGNNDKLVAIVVIDEFKLKNSKVSNINAHVKDIIEFYNGFVHNYEKILDYKITTEELPKTRIGKLRRFMLKDIYNGQMEVKKEEKYEEPNEREYEILKEYLIKMKGEVPHPDKNLEIDFGLDSLDQIEFISFIENSFSLKLSEEEFKENITLRNLAKYISEKSNVYIESKGQWSDIISKIEKKEFKKGFFTLILKPIFWVLLKIYFRISIKDSKKIKDEQQIFIANHESFIDVLALNLLLPIKISKKTYSLAINWYFKNAFMKFFADNSNVILLDIDNNIKETIEQVASCLKAGNNVFIFPEGTRTKDGNVGQFKKIFAILAKEFNLPITCLKIDGAYEAYSRYDKFPKPKKLTVKYLGQIKPENLSYSEIVEKSRDLYITDNEKIKK